MNSSQSINFFGRAGDLYQRTRQQDQKFLKWALIGFGIVVGIFLILLTINLILGQQLKRLNTQQLEGKQSLVNNQSVEVAYLIFSHKLAAIAQIFEQRNNKQQAINYLSSLFGSQVFISGVTYEGTAQVLSLNLNSANIFDLSQLLEQLDTPEVKQNFSSLVKSNIRRNDDGSYDLKLTLELKAASASAKTSPGAGAGTSARPATKPTDIQ
jgi:hypothetical protein